MHWIHYVTSVPYLSLLLFITMKIMMYYYNNQTKATAKVWYNQKQKKGNNIQHSWVVTNLFIVCMNFGVTLRVCTDF